jgi:hypothetical protein
MCGLDIRIIRKQISDMKTLMISDIVRSSLKETATEQDSGREQRPHRLQKGKLALASVIGKTMEGGYCAGK